MFTHIIPSKNKLAGQAVPPPKRTVSSSFAFTHKHKHKHKHTHTHPLLHNNTSDVVYACTHAHTSSPSNTSGHDKVFFSFVDEFQTSSQESKISHLCLYVCTHTHTHSLPLTPTRASVCTFQAYTFHTYTPPLVQQHFRS